MPGISTQFADVLRHLIGLPEVWKEFIPLFGMWYILFHSPECRKLSRFTENIVFLCLECTRCPDPEYTKLFRYSSTVLTEMFLKGLNVKLCRHIFWLPLYPTKHFDSHVSHTFVPSSCLLQQRWERTVTR
jgi:hypothetical protein